MEASDRQRSPLSKLPSNLAPTWLSPIQFNLICRATGPVEAWHGFRGPQFHCCQELSFGVCPVIIPASFITSPPLHNSYFVCSKVRRQCTAQHPGTSFLNPMRFIFRHPKTQPQAIVSVLRSLPELQFTSPSHLPPEKTASDCLNPSGSSFGAPRELPASSHHLGAVQPCCRGDDPNSALNSRTP